MWQNRTNQENKKIISAQTPGVDADWRHFYCAGEIKYILMPFPSITASVSFLAKKCQIYSDKNDERVSSLSY